MKTCVSLIKAITMIKELNLALKHVTTPITFNFISELGTPPATSIPPTHIKKILLNL